MDRAPRTAVACFAVLAAAIVLIRLPQLHGVVQDDGFIYFRIADNLARGNGPVFNPGERVDAATSPAWVTLLAAAATTGVALPLAGTILGLVCAMAAAVLSAQWALELAPSKHLRAVLVALAGPLLLLADGRFTFYGASGMETSLAALAWIAAARALVRRWFGKRPERSAGWLALAACLVRPEFVLFVGALAVVTGLRRSVPWRDVGWTLLPVAAGGLLYLGAHTLYFGDPLPNTYRAKTASDWTHLRIGLAWLAGLPRTYPWLLAAAAALAVPPLRPAAAALLLGLVLYALQYARVGGDHFVFHRPFVMVLPLFLALAGAAAAHLAQSRIRAVRVATVALATAALVTGLRARIEPRPFAWVRVAAQLGHALARTYPAGTRTGMFAIGAAGYTSRLPVVDALGLADRHVARADLSREHACALDIGHERGDPEYVLERSDIVVFFGAFAPVPFESLDEVREGFYSHKKFLAAAKQAVVAGRFRLRNIEVAPGVSWAILERTP